MEILPIITYASEIAIDSRNGFIYWSTGYTIRFSLLNGSKRSQKELFRANEIRSISVNNEQQILYWIAITNSGTATLYKADLIRSLLDMEHRPTISTVNILPDISLIGPISNFAGRLFWLNMEQKRIQISDGQMKTFATVKELNHITAFDIVDTNYPSYNHTVCVMPDAVDPEQIIISGTWDNFTIKWTPVTNVNYGQVFYDLMLEDSLHRRTNIILNQNEFHYSNQLKQLKPYSKIKIAVRSFTYWASAKQVVVNLHTPSSIPSKPKNVRVFTFVSQNLLTLNTEYRSNWKDSISAEARWSPPVDPNGMIQSYTVSLWTVPYKNKVTSIINKVIPNQLTYRFENLNVNSTYYFEVRATTDVGEGAPSDVYQFKTFQDDPPSRLLLSESNSIVLTDMDLNRKELEIKSLTPLMVDYIYNENIIYWIEEGNFLKRTSLLNASKYNLVAHLHEQTTGLSIDWIGRRVYISTIDHIENRSTIWYYDHSNQHAQVEKVVSFIGKHIHSLRINPFDSQLIWVESTISTATNGASRPHASLKICQLINYGTKCNSVRDLFTRDRRRLKTKMCNCTYSTTVAQTFALDYSEYSDGKIHLDHSKVKIVYYDQYGKYFATADLNGCFCRRLTPTIVEKENFPISMTFDKDIYWINNSTDGRVYRALVHSIDQQYSNLLHDRSSRVVDVFEYGANTINSVNSYNIRNQPYVHFNCLIPHNIRTVVSLVDSTAYSLVLSVEHFNTYASSLHGDDSIECGNIASASLRYRIKYRKHDNTHVDCRQDGVCQSLSTYNSTFTITDLEPFTNYTIMVELDNYYLELNRNATRKQIQLANNGSWEDNVINGRNNVMFVPTEDYRYLLNDNLVFCTAESRPGPPLNVRTIVETPEKILVLWDAPEKLNSHDVSYEVRWYSVESSRKSLLHSNNRTKDGSYYMYLENVKPNKEYNVTVRAYAVDNNQFMDSDPVLVHSYRMPNTLMVSKVEPHSMTLNWLSPSKPIIDSHQLFMQEDHDDDDNENHFNWTTFAQEYTRPKANYEFVVKNLKPNTRYRFQLLLIYKPSNVAYNWPRKALIVPTQSTVPETPMLNNVTPVNDDESDSARIFKLTWDPVKSNSEDQVYYILYECLLNMDNTRITLNDEVHNISNYEYENVNNWSVVYNGTETYWIVSGLESGKSHQFRLVAHNTLGDSSYSNVTEPFYLPFADDYEIAHSNENVLVLTFIICSIFTIFFISILIYSCMYPLSCSV